MRKLISVLAVVVLALAFGAPTLAAEGDLSHNGRVLIGLGGDVSLPAYERADAVVVIGGRATVAGEAVRAWLANQPRPAVLRTEDVELPDAPVSTAIGHPIHHETRR